METARQNSAKATVVIVYLLMAVSLRADSIFPTTTFYCSNNRVIDSSCSGSAGQLPSVNGIQGIGMNFGGSNNNGGGDFQFAIIGNLSGDDLPAGTLIPYSFSFIVTSVNPFGTEIRSYTFGPAAVLPLPPNDLAPGPIAGGEVSQSSTITHNGNCAPGPSGPTNTCWGLSVNGTGVFELSSSAVSSGSLVEIPLYAEIDTENLSGTPSVSISGTIDFNPIPEPMYSPFALLGGGVVVFLWRRRRTALRATRGDLH